ncbi:MAG: hypothetical protein HOO06_10825 [Bdellovibrionaceae bacterium]|jgi:NADH-quinone oxidoreductase subunit J|nr:hypothetical protein [Pseudobdellovibrionaceae bacterium]
MYNIETLFIYLLSIVSVLSAVLVVTQRRIIRSVSALMMVLLVTAGMYVILNAEFLTGVQVLVYIGGIVILIIFAIMLTGAGKTNDDEVDTHKKLLAFAVSFLFLLCSTYAIVNTPIKTVDTGANSSVRALGLKLLDYSGTGHVLAFEVISLLLLAVLIGAIVVARKTEEAKNA